MQPYQDLDDETRERAVHVLRDWAARQDDPNRPFLEFLDGTTLAPADLLAEPPPTEKGKSVPSQRRSLRRTLKRAAEPGEVDVWTHVLNLVAVTAMSREGDVSSILDEIESGTDAQGPSGLATT